MCYDASQMTALICISVVPDGIGVGRLEVVLYLLNLVHYIWSLLISHKLLATPFIWKRWNAMI